MTIPIFDLYKNCPKLYDSFANDRDFASQCNNIIDYLGFFPAKTIELMAGPARHSIEFLKIGIKSAVAIDESEAMHEYCQNMLYGNKVKYIIGKVPTTLLEIESELCDCILLLRFGIGYLDITNLRKTLEQGLRLLSSRGCIFVECHRFDLLSEGLNDIDIRERTIKGPNGEELVVIWPSGSPRWDQYGRYVDMDVLIEGNDGTKKSYLSREYIYGIREIKSLVDSIGGYLEIIDNSNLVSFGNYSTIFSISKKDQK